MAEAAIPTDAMVFADPENELARVEGAADREIYEQAIYGTAGAQGQVIDLTRGEADALTAFDRIRREEGRIEGQVTDELRRVGLKLVIQGLRRLLPLVGDPYDCISDWESLRMVASEPRHLLRAIPPSTSDIIMAHRLGTLAVDNAVAGYTDFMIANG
jgi:6-phosphofructokinase